MISSRGVIRDEKFYEMLAFLWQHYSSRVEKELKVKPIELVSTDVEEKLELQ